MYLPDDARHVIRLILNPRCLSHMASYDVASDICQALTSDQLKKGRKMNGMKLGGLGSGVAAAAKAEEEAEVGSGCDPAPSRRNGLVPTATPMLSRDQQTIQMCLRQCHSCTEWWRRRMWSCDRPTIPMCVRGCHDCTERRRRRRQTAVRGGGGDVIAKGVTVTASMWANGQGEGASVTAAVPGLWPPSAKSQGTRTR
jgi:hypothetical protein